MTVNELIKALKKLPEEDRAKPIVDCYYDEITEVKLTSLDETNDVVLIE